MTKLGCCLPEADPMMLGAMPDKSIPWDGLDATDTDATERLR
jgi:hypothetical protein